MLRRTGGEVERRCGDGLPARLLPVPGPVAALAAAGMLLAAVALPLATYTTTLALFGLAHVLSELRYVDARFGRRLGTRLAGRFAALLLGAAALRLAGMQGWLRPEAAVAGELALAALLVALVVGRMRHRRWLGGAVAGGLAAGAVLAPFATLLAAAILHNLTPLGFLAERLRGARRRRAMAVAALAFLGLPLLVATGLPFRWLAGAGLVAPEAALFPAGGLADHLPAYVPASALWSDWALHAFAASVLAQCLHYAVVIGVLPRLAGEAERPARGAAGPLLRWPSGGPLGWRFLLGLGAAGAGLALGFWLDYAAAKRVYALAALLHAWVEWPILLLALGAGLQARPSA
ncbi:hypothetical protein M0638_05805 [Roseomonas sp. NAR14]|uniref:Uncharacterized protein n=1 Tax=Roseomonas acroporae TaxID=2937791 RepID=A0A9X1Y6D0_9PROT|nr:hypothetical protein [Roseomonas acroporae]MCK8783895.1 hypothetical protein [Roseomonas acroporae]